MPDSRSIRTIDNKDRVLKVLDEHPIYNVVALCKVLGDLKPTAVYNWINDDKEFGATCEEKFRRNKAVRNKTWLDKSDVLWDSVFASAEAGCIKSVGFAVNISKDIKQSLDEDFKPRQEIKHEGDLNISLSDRLTRAAERIDHEDK